MLSWMDAAFLRIRWVLSNAFLELTNFRAAFTLCNLTPSINLRNAQIREIVDFPGPNSFWLEQRTGLIFGHILLRIIRSANFAAIEDKDIPYSFPSN